MTASFDVPKSLMISPLSVRLSAECICQHSAGILLHRTCHVVNIILCVARPRPAFRIEIENAKEL